MPAGTGQPLEGQTSCEMCPPGFANPGNSDAGCQICQEGFFSEAQGSATCQRCAKGFYSDQKGEQSCQPCSTKGSETRTTDTLGSVSRKQCVCKSGYFFTGLYTNGFNGTIRANDLVNATLPRGTCKLCNDNLYKCPGRFDPPRAKPGYYMESYRIRDNNDFPTIYECNPRSSCPGGGPRSCSAHRVGLACGRCEEGYTRGSGGRCSKCFMSGGIFGFFLLCLLVMMPIAMYFYAKTSYVAPRRGRSENVSGVSSRSVMSSQAERDAALDPNKAFLIILSFLQHIGIISSFNLRIVVQVSTLLSLPRLLMVDPSILGVSCFGLDSFSRQIGYLFSIPIIFITAVAILHFTLEGFLFYGKKWDCLNPDKARGRRKAWLHWFRRKFVDTAHGLGLIRIVATTTQVSSFMYVALVSIAMAHVDCFRHPSGDFTVRTHPYVICDWESARGQEWRDQMWLSWIGIFLYIICPYIASIAISFRMQKLTDLKRRDKAAHLEGFDEVFSAAFRYVVGKYRQGMVWWECVWMARNASLALSTALVPNIGQLQLLYYAVILTFYAFATMSFAPWRRSANSKLDIALTVLLLHIVTLIGLFYTFALPPSDINATDARAATGALMFIYLLLIVPITWWYGSRHPQRYFDRRHPQGLLGKTASKWLNMFNSLPNLRGMEGQRRNPLTGSITDDDISPRPRRNKINPKLSVRSDLGNESDPFSRGTIESDDGYESPRPGRRPRPHHRGTTESPSASSSDIKFTSSRRGDDSTTGGRLTAHANASQTRVVPGLHMKQDGAWAGKPGPDTTAMSDVDAFDDQDGLESGLSDRGGHSVRTPAHKEVFLGFESQLRKTMRMSESRSGSNPFESAVRP
ncbi:unnamed protein product [Vitrella brassicaformis CCMP3155]|uniref:Tyrosine-protein kinase ephrin type A/B receptor-like domain-containing protein n=2 Tax=Vitrella brassicaformis TaxID=1169539 RepID=A0A0G4EFI7_VITBC|nr:unnamed protein product [Vitrella brassicaformis CCMP3155]|eukprot:CEL94266.1 unnamed protein product [Vitrella brassicaformis CCMP3155]